MTEVPYNVTELHKPPASHPVERDPGAPDLWTPDEMYGIGANVVKRVLPWTEADPAMLYLSLLVAVASAIGPGPYMWVGGEKHTPRLWGVGVGGTSRGRKGTSWADVRQVFDLAVPEWVAGNVGSGLSSGEGLVQALTDLPGTKNFLAVETEFSKVLTVSSRSGNTLADQIRQLYDGDRVSILNKKAVVLTGAYFSLVGHITGEELRAKIPEVDLANGFANRILWAYSQRSKLVPEGPHIPDALLMPVATKLSEAIARGREIKRLNRTAAASRRWGRLYRDLARTRPLGLLGAVTSRAEAQCLRLSMLFAVLDGKDVIRTEHIDAAERVWRYCEQSAMYVFGSATGNPHADKVLTHLQLAPNHELTRKDIYQKVFSNNLGKQEIDAVRQTLEDRGLIAVRQQKTRGRSAEMWTLHS